MHNYKILTSQLYTRNEEFCFEMSNTRLQKKDKTEIADKTFLCQVMYSSRKIADR